MLKKPIKEIMETNVISLSQKAPLSEALSLMADNNISFVVIASKENEPLGVLTERDILRKAWDKKSDELHVSDVMSSNVFSISADDDIMTAIHSLVNRNIRHLVAVDNEGEICGVLTLTDFLKKLGFEYFVDFKDIEELMDRSPLTLPADTDAFDALSSLSKSDKSCLIAIEDSRPTGIFTERDALRITQEGKNLSGISLKKLMSIPVVYLQEGSCVFEALSVLNKNKVRHLPVINSNGELSGLISQIDIARGMELKHTAFLKKIIEEQEKNLKEANDRLEERIAERTKKLAKANEKLKGEIEDRKLAEKELKKLSLAINQSPASIVITDREGNIEYINPKFTQITGYSSEEAMGQNPRILKSGEQSPEFYKQLWETITSGKEWRGELYNKRKDGKFFWENASISPVLNDKGEIKNFIAVKEDITERKQSEENLLKSKERFRNLVETTSDWVWEIDENAVYTYASPQIQRILGYRFEEIVGKTPFELMPREEANRVAALFKPIVASQKPFDCLENINLHKDGTPVVLETSGVPVFDADGKFCGYRGVDRDITKRKQAEESLRLLEKALKTTNMGVTITDTEGKIIYTNPADAEMHGYSLEELMGKNIGIFAPEELRKGLTPKQIETAKTKKRESVNIRKDGSTFPVYLISDIVKSTTGDPIGLVTTCEDITERKQAEEALRISDERYSLAIEGSNDGIWERNLVTGETYFSPRWKETIGYRDSEFPNHVDEWKKRVHPDDYDMVIKNVGDYLVGMTDHYISEYRMQHKDGSWRWILAKGAKVCDDQENPTRFAGSHTDITERKKAEEERKSLEAQLLQAQKMETMGTLAGGIAHDFNNILSPMLICAEIALEDTSKDSEMHEVIETIFKAAHRAKDLVKRILLFSRRGEQNRETLNIGEVVKEALKLARSSIPSTITISKKIKLKEETISADPIQIHQLVMNLCTNAYQAMQGSSGEIKVELSTININHGSKKVLRLKEGEYILLSISDTGHGIDESTKQRIFDPFFTTKAIGKGTGLGLSVVMGIVMNHDGEIKVESKVGKGSTFHIYLPLSDNAESTTLQREDKADPKGVEKVLFVDDESALAFVGKAALEQLGYKVTVSSNPAEALQLFAQSPDHFDILITDYTMPNMTGLQLAIEAKKISNNIPVIIISGYNDTISEENMSRFNIDEYLMKPFAGHQLGRTIRKVMAKK